MGYSLSWLAFKGSTVEAGLEILGLSKTGSVGEWGRKSVSGHALPNGWHLVIAPRCDHPLVSESSLAVLSRAAEVLACRVEEHVMFSSAEFWKQGEKVWSVEHDAQQDKRHLKFEGSLPDPCGVALQEAEEQQDAEDLGPNEVDFYFEVPLQTANEIAGFKHDEENPALNYKQFEVYAPSSIPLGEGATRKWWQIWK
jgi:hypothetical protein